MTAGKRSAGGFSNIRKALPINLLVWVLLLLYMLPLFSMVVTSMMSGEQLSDKQAPLYPARSVMYSYQGKDYPLYEVPVDGVIKQMALIKPGAKSSKFLDPQHPEAGPIVWKGGYRTLAGVYEFHISWENFTGLFTSLPFPGPDHRIDRGDCCTDFIHHLRVRICAVQAARWKPDLLYFDRHYSHTR